MRPRTPERKEMYKKAGFRERYAMEHGNGIKRIENGNILIQFNYSKCDPYQDANGATYNETLKIWIN